MMEAIPPEILKPSIPSIPSNIHGSEDFKDCVRLILTKYLDVFNKQVGKEPAKVSPLVIDVDKRRWEVVRNRQPARKLGSLRDAELERQCELLVKMGVIELSKGGYYSYAFLVPKPNGDWRFVLDFQGLNKATNNVERCPIPNINELLRRISEKKPRYFAIMDLTSGFSRAQ